MSRKERRDAADNRAALVAAARALFAERGPGVPLADIAAAAGVSRTTLHRHFTSRNDLAAEVLAENVDRIEQRADVLRARPGAARRLLEFVLDMQATDRSATHILLTDHARLAALADRTAAAFKPLVAQARREGVLQPGVTTADVLLALQMADAALQEEESAVRARVSGRARRLLLRGLFTA
jgi:AcrR family transcriptional regulator